MSTGPHGVAHPNGVLFDVRVGKLTLVPARFSFRGCLPVGNHASSDVYCAVPGIYLENAFSRQIYENKGTVLEIPS